MRTFVYLFIVSIGLLLPSCEKTLDFEPAQSISEEEIFADLDGMKTLLAATYNGLGARYYYGSTFLIVPEIEGNLCYLAFENGNRFVHQYLYQFTSTDVEVTGFWNSAYNVIFRANQILEHIDDVEGTSSQKNQIKGEALAIRALAHFDLVRFYSRQYSYGNPQTDPGIPIVLETGLVDPPRNHVAAVYDQIITDLNDALSILGDVGVHHFSPNAVAALLARVYLYMGDWEQAEQWSKAIINSSQFELANSFEDLFYQPFSSEVILNLDFSVDNCLYNAFCSDDIRVTTDLVDSYEVADQRRRVNAFQVLIGSPYYQNKFCCGGLKFLRLAEMYLIRAEARFRLDDTDGALADLNTLRLKRGATEWDELPNGILDILAERQRELAFEGHTVFDYWRTGTDMVRLQCNTGVELESPCMIEASSYLATHPIPQSEMDANQNMVQNEGY